MPAAEIITIGTELLLGETQDTNTRSIARSLREIGVDLYRTTTIGDNIDRIANLIQEISSKNKIILNYVHGKKLFFEDLIINSCQAILYNPNSKPKNLKKIILSPQDIRSKLYNLIDQEINNIKSGKNAEIWAKMNSLVDQGMIDKFYQASKAGVKIFLFVRGVCCLRAGIENLSENIVVKSIVGRFLEHSRIFCFANGHSMPSRSNLIFIG